MKFLKQPCANCPFRQDQHYGLRPERVQEIDFMLRHDGIFTCHKEIDRVARDIARLDGSDAQVPDDFYDDGGAVPSRHQGAIEPAGFCGGALHWMQQHDLLRANRVTRLALVLGLLPDPLPPSAAPVAEDIFHMAEDLDPSE